MIRAALTAALAAAFMHPSAVGADPAIIADAAVAKNGDDLIVAGRDVRLFGIDAPELNQTCLSADGRPWPCGQVARRRLDELAKASPRITCVVRRVGRHGRPIARCWSDEGDVAMLMVVEGLAVAYRRYSHIYVDHERLARSNHAGIWAGTFIMPEAWRRAHGF